MNIRRVALRAEAATIRFPSRILTKPCERRVPDLMVKQEEALDSSSAITHVMVTGATGFVGRQMIRTLLAHGLTPVCLVRDAEKLRAQHKDVDAERLVPIVGGLKDAGSLREAADRSQAAGQGARRDRA